MQHPEYERIVAFDVETPNARNDRMSAIGIAVIENGTVTDRFFSLVDPETHFDRFNIELTGITPEAVQDAPTFSQLWPRIGPLLQSGLLAAHNAPFDMKVLSLCLQTYQVKVPRYARYVCTVQMGRRCYPQLPDRRLNTLCAHTGIALDHHQADSDSLACAGLLLDYAKHGLAWEPFVRIYDLQAMCTLGRSGGSRNRGSSQRKE
ncbi:MAG: 3'-5' exonuclease [Lachnospiraceae bacterium]|nr:3'-5' exonuclease [Lachnospiraceae bacterium]